MGFYPPPPYDKATAQQWWGNEPQQLQPEDRQPGENRAAHRKRLKQQGLLALDKAKRGRR